MSNFLLWLIAQNTTQSLAHQMQKDDPKLWNIAQFSLFLEVTIFLLIGFYFLIPEVFWGIVLFAGAAILLTFAVRHMDPKKKRNGETADGLSIGWYILFLVAGLAFALVVFHMIAV